MANIVALGGGTGLSVILRGLKEVSSDITAVVTVADDGGGSGVLREDLGMLPPGDVRNCILALANKEPILQDLFQYRFTDGRLKNQNFGNLMIAAMVGISESFEQAIQKIADIFAITGKVYPVSEEDLILYAQLSDGTIVVGESNIPYESMKRKAGIQKVWIDPVDAKTSPQVIERIESADVIVLGPGSLFTSVIPNLLIDEVVNAIAKSKAKVFYIANIMTQPGESDHLSAGEHLECIYKHTAIKKIDYLVANNGALSKAEVEKYGNESSKRVEITEMDLARLSELNVGLIADDYIEVVKGYVRHDAKKISKDIMKHIEKVYTP